RCRRRPAGRVISNSPRRHGDTESEQRRIEMKAAKQLAIAAGQGDVAAMRALLDADPSLAKDWQPIMDACFAGQVAAVELLLDRGADPNVVSKSTFRYRPLHRTIERK